MTSALCGRLYSLEMPALNEKISSHILRRKRSLMASLAISLLV
jgi:hypothetical protein